MESLIKKILMSLNDANNIVVFVGDHSLIDSVTVSLVPMLPEHFTANIDIRHIDTSTKYLKGHKFCVSHYHDSCFRYISPHEFLRTHYTWLYRNITRLYQRTPGYDVDDLFQDFCLKYLDRILSKVTEESYPHLRVFVYNRMRRYVDYLIKEQLKIRRDEILCTLYHR